MIDNAAAGVVLASTTLSTHNHVFWRVLVAVGAFVQLAVRVDVFFDQLRAIVKSQLVS